VEIIYNPGNLLWFQNIELTALNSAQITARSSAEGNNNSGLNSQGGYYATNLFSNPPLVEYKKEGRWIFYRDTIERYANYLHHKSSYTQQMVYAYQHYGYLLSSAIAMFHYSNDSVAFDSVVAVFSDDQINRFQGFVKGKNAMHVHIDYHEKTVQYSPLLDILYGHRSTVTFSAVYSVKETGYYNEKGERIGEWKYYHQNGTLWKTENYFIPTAEQTTAGR
jgi:hypothetical protein